MRTKLCLKAAVATAGDHIAQDITFSELVNAYCAVQFDGADYRMKKWIDALGDLSAWDVTAEQINAGTRAMIDAGYAASTVNRDVSTLGTIYKWAKKRKMSPRGFLSPTRGAERYEEQLRIVSLTDQEVQKLLHGAYANPDRRFAVYVRLLHETGCRKSEVGNRRWMEVDIDAGQIALPAHECKTGRARTLFFSQETALMMRRIWPHRDPEALLFEGRIPGQAIDYRAAWRELTKTIGRPDLHQHDMRHHRAAELLKAGSTIAVTSQVLGHSSLILQRRYGHLETEHLQSAITASWREAA